ncbi:hypothetical protein ebA53 [Aromatoleum aromaticum EbN1]|uniref:Uncharacterized protein n=1 Tax=Aromatoleum aromaticum (strain DSM 19018 / LMG 30748 / EbN1) TaxID=76114 RepID=Q5P957_AROAE|nr:hypothetical protein ebA53 [Aromatoleum aromaticum EbN1]
MRFSTATTGSLSNSPMTPSVVTFRARCARASIHSRPRPAAPPAQGVQPRRRVVRVGIPYS